MEVIYAKCNKSCGYKFYVQSFKNVRLSHTIEKNYFTCPNCGREYVCFYTDDNVRKLQAELRKLYLEMRRVNGFQYRKLKKIESALKQSIFNSMTDIKNMVER
ncbi:MULTISPECIES: hypothetical protein [Lysinibacillus]|uniref:hypothetical protein n=1 Tax=Lysinibacillus TaxID=400634 RepID=UPI001C8C7332|nr:MULTISPECIES: hypothetical protein [Lysinibacillus]MBX8944825.1 hypothetical protein [Lysinibacillus sp. K60]UUV23606.1 hypothetical protein NP781_17500 [Lysinibacillus sp. FN11]UYB46478.1 hypothetical protein OCI51_20105 [Lysinibacillus capsici]WDU78664.1 hypothetical protein PSR12_18740 [Lysinibacillus sp. G01H]